jgi:hypothetical protein
MDTTALRNKKLSQKRLGNPLYPNPFVNNVLIKSAMDTVVVTLFDVSGKLLFEKFYESASKSQRLDVDHLPVGIYWVSISRLAQIETNMFIKTLK